MNYRESLWMHAQTRTHMDVRVCEHTSQFHVKLTLPLCFIARSLHRPPRSISIQLRIHDVFSRSGITLYLSTSDWKRIDCAQCVEI